MKIFCTVSDCNFDYSSPTYFKKSSRSIVRVGELRITSNLVSPAGPVQTFKVSIGDVSIHLCNKRGRYEEENVRVSCSNLILMPEVVLKKKHVTLSHSYDDALFQLDFIAVASLDYLEGIFSIDSNSSIKRRQNVDPPDAPSVADSTLTLSIGKICIFACKDSFELFTSTINELILKLTMPSKKELDVMRQEYFGKDTKNVLKTSHDVNQQNTLPNDDTFLEETPVSLNDVMNDGLFSDGEMYDDAYASEEGAPILLQMHDEMTVTPTEYRETHMDRHESFHEVIHDFYEYDGSQSPNSYHNASKASDVTDYWTAIDHPWTDDPFIPEGQDQAAKWYTFNDDGAKKQDTIPELKPPSGTVIVEGKNLSGRQPRIFNRHIPLTSISDPLSGGDMGVSKFAGTKQISVKMRVFVTDMNFLCRLFDGYDWPSYIVTKKVSNSKSKLLGDLVGDDDDSPGLFSDKKNISKMNDVKKRKSRQSERYFQFSFAGMKLRLDSFHTSEEHFVSSCLDMKLNDMNLIETVSSDKLVKLLGEWVNEDDHPRDSDDGLLMMKVSCVKLCVFCPKHTPSSSQLSTNLFSWYHYFQTNSLLLMEN